MPLTRTVNLHRYSNSNSGDNVSTENLDPITYNPRYPWFDEANYRKLESKIDALGLTWYDKEKAMDDLYIQVLPKVQDDIKNSERRKYINDASYEVSQIQDSSARLQAKWKLTVTELAQKLKETFNIDPSANDEEVFNSWIESIPNGWQLLADYMNNGNRELLYEWGLAKKMEAPEVKESSVWGIQSIINKQSEIDSDSTLWKLNNTADRVNLPWKATEWIDSLVQKIPTATYEKQVENLANKINNLSEDEMSSLYNQYVNMIRNGSDEKWKDDKRWAWELFWDAITWDEDAVDRLNTLHLYDYSEAMPQDWIERNQRWSQAWDNLVWYDKDTVNKVIEDSDASDIVKWLAKAWAWTADKSKNLLNFIWWSWGWLENYAESLGVWLQQLDDIRDMRTAPTQWLENNEDAFNTFVADKTANFGEYITDAPKTLLGKPVTPNAAKFISNIPQSFFKLLSWQVRGKTNPLDTKVWLLKMLFTEEWQQAMIDRYGTLENLANTMNTDPVWLADDMIDRADKFNMVTSKASWGRVPRRSIGSYTDALSDSIVNWWTIWKSRTKDENWDYVRDENWNYVTKDVNIQGINNGLSNLSNWFRNKWFNRTANLVDLERDVSTNPSMIKEDTKKIAKQWAEDIVDASKATAEFVSKIPEKTKNLKDNAVEWIAERMSWNKTAQDKLFQAQEPTLNRLSKERNTQQIRNKSDVANELIVKDIEKNWGALPTDTQSRVDAHERAMKNKWKEIEEKLWDRWKVEISTAQLADDLDKYIASIEKLKITKNKSDLDALKEQSADLRAMWNVDLLTLEKQKEMINANLNDWDDKSIWNVYKNWMTELTRNMWKIEDAIISRIPWEFQDLKNDFGALADGYGDVVKANVKSQRAKFQDSISNYSRIKWIWDILKWVWHWDLWEIGKWAAQTIGWDVTAKLKDKDWLIEEWFKNLAEDMKKPDFKSAKKNKAWQPKQK